VQIPNKISEFFHEHQIHAGNKNHDYQCLWKSKAGWKAVFDTEPSAFETPLPGDWME
jgi:hypothetical protein